MKTWIYNIKHGIRNLFHWRKVIWNDRNWDWEFIADILYHKLQDMESYFRENGHLFRSDRTVNEIKRSRLVLDRLRKDVYFEIAFRSHDRKWGEGEMEFLKKEDGRCVLNIKRANVTEENEDLERKEFRKWSEHETYLRNQDLEYLSRLLKKHLFTWWD